MGFADPWIAIVFFLCIGSTLLCVVWGVLRWNRDDAVGEPGEPELRQWAAEEDRVEQEL